MQVHLQFDRRSVALSALLGNEEVNPSEVIALKSLIESNRIETSEF